jgi:KDO2-lipid IV(A) lauroyltransferase
MSERRVSLKKKIDNAFLISISRVIRCFAAVVPYRVGVYSGALLGFVAFYLLPRERNRTLDNLSRVFVSDAPRQLRQRARASFMHLGKALLEVMLMTPKRLSRNVSIEGEENLRNAIGRGKGVIFVSGHLGSWELMAQVVAARSNLSVVAAPIKPEPVNDMIVQLRANMGVRTILRGRPGSSRELIRVFKENRILGILIDQDTDIEGTFAPFLGLPAWTPTGAASMAIKFNAPVLFGYMHRGRDNRHQVKIEGPVELIRTGDNEKDIITNTAMFNKMIGDAIMKNPAQWVWMHRRWRKQP